MIKKIGLLATFLFLIISLIACGGQNEPEAATESNEEQNSSSNESQELVVMDFGGATTEARKKAYYDPFEEKYGVKVITVTPADYGKIKAMVETGNVTVDVVDVYSDFLVRGAREGYFEKLDFDVINQEGIFEEYLHDYGVGAFDYSLVIGFNTDAFPEGKQPESWADFWDTENFPGPRSLQKSPMGTLEAALLADGVKPEELYPLDVDRAFASLDKIKKDVKVWWEVFAQPAQLLSNGEVTMASSYNGRITSAQAEGAPVDLEFNQGIRDSGFWVIPKGAPNKDLAMKFIDFVSSPEPQAEFSTLIDYGPTNEDAIELLPDEVKERLGSEKVNQQITLNSAWWVDNFEEVNERFNVWLLEK